MSFESSNPQRHGRLGRSGTTSLELAFILVPFFWFVMGIVDLTRYLFTVHEMVTLMTDVGRYSLVYPNIAPVYSWIPWPDTATSAPLLDPNLITLSVTPLSTNGVTQIQIIVQYPFIATTPGFSVLNGALTETTIVAF